MKSSKREFKKIKSNHLELNARERFLASQLLEIADKNEQIKKRQIGFKFGLGLRFSNDEVFELLRKLSSSNLASFEKYFVILDTKKLKEVVEK